MKYAFIQAHQEVFPVNLMCQLFSVTRSSYYAWCVHTSSEHSQTDRQLKEKVRQIFEDSRQTYGTRRIKVVLAKQGMQVSRKRIGRLMREMKLACRTKRKFKATTNSKHNLPVAPNRLKRHFNVTAPNKVYVGDITYIWTQEGWLYLAAVIDLYSRKVVGWSMQDNMKADLVNQALLMAVWQRKPSKGLLSHSDRGSQYASKSHRAILSEHGIIQSMSRKGDCWDNAVAESFFHTLKTELIYGRVFKTREEAQKVIFEYIEVFYNRNRLHSANDYQSPVEYEAVAKFS